MSDVNLHYQETIILEPQILAALCRRGRRSFRNIKSSSEASLKLDRSQGVLLVTGRRSCILKVQKQLESLSGPSLVVSAAVWAELMRTRINPDQTQAAVARIQEESGCRIHIERDVQEVRLFGSDGEVAAAQELFKELENMCIEDDILMKYPLQLDLENLQTFAQESRVALQVEENRITVLGIAGAVLEAIKQLRSYDTGKQDSLQGVNSEAAHSAIDTAMSKLAIDYWHGSRSTTADSLPQHSQSPGMQASKNQMSGFVIAKLPPTCTERAFQEDLSNRTVETCACPTCGASGNFCVHCGKKRLEYPAAGCQTCGAVKFCAFCGQATEGMNLERSLSSQHSSPDSPSQFNEPIMCYADQVPMMPKQIVVQSNMANHTSAMMPDNMMVPGMMPGNMIVMMAPTMVQGATYPGYAQP